ncbi:MAG: amino acid ABC transporter substrate-binding protein [Bacteroidota bacterium]
MILAQNPLPRLSGSKYYLGLLLGLFLFACSPKVRKQTETKIPDQISTNEKPVEKPAAKFSQARIALLVPFHLSEVNLKTATRTEVEKSAMAIDFYQGFKMGLDSASGSGLNFALSVYDTKQNNVKLESLIKGGGLNAENLIVGPVFPEGLKYISAYSSAKKIPVVNPLSASHPNEFRNPNLISVVNNIDLHIRKLGDFISENYSPQNTVVVLINPKDPDSEVMGNPVRNYFASSKKRFTFQEYSSVFTMEMKLVKNKKYVIIVSSSDRKFIVPSLDKLIKLKSAGLLNLDLFGHPDWIKQNYNTDKLQALRTSVTASYKIDYSSNSVKEFIKKYRHSYHFEPGEYAFKGFDIGLYFGTLLAKHGPQYLQYLTKENYKGLHNRFSFVYDEKLGFINTSLMLLRYENFSLNFVE